MDPFSAGHLVAPCPSNRDNSIRLIVETEGTILDSATRPYIRFTIPEWDLPALKVATNWTSSGRVILLEFRNSDRLDLVVVIGPSLDPIRNKLLEPVQQKVPPMRQSGRLGGKWVTGYKRTVLQSRDYETYSDDELQDRVRAYWNEFLGSDLPSIKAAMNIPNLVGMSSPEGTPPTDRAPGI
ncbi:MAG: hypothetical protein M3R38_12225 [Actinomycetota bacterium]|nr:hypothetical protein [Actinomycetota bacterium]